MTYQQTSSRVWSDGLSVRCRPYPIAEGAVMRGNGSLIALNQLVKSPVWGIGKVIWFSVAEDQSRWAQVHFYGIDKVYSILASELQPVSDLFVQTEGVAQ